MQLSEAVREIIRLGDGSRAYWDRELPKHHPRYPVVRDGEDSVLPPPEDAKILALLNGLSEDQVYSLILLMYVGRGDISADHLSSAYQEMKDTFDTKELAIAQMIGKGTLSEYMADAIREIEKRHIDLDNLDLPKAAALN